MYQNVVNVLRSVGVYLTDLKIFLVVVWITEYTRLYMRERLL